METAQGPFSSLNPMDIFTQLGTPGLTSIDQSGTEPFYGSEHTAYHELTSYADDVNQAQALTEAIKASRTDMTAAVPAQKYIEDTRNSKWTITNTSQGFATQGTTTAYLSSAQCVDLKTTRITGSVQITTPALAGAAATDFYILPSGFPLMCFTYGLQIGQNGNVLQDPGTATDQFWLTQMRLGKKRFDESDLIYSITPWQTAVPANVHGNDGDAFNWYTNPDSFGAPADVAEVTLAAGAVAQQFTATFTMRPTHSFFNIVKTWPPNIPLKLIITWNPALTESLVGFAGNAANAPPQVSLLIHTIRSEELYLEPSMRSFIMNHFETGPGTNYNQLALARTMNRAALFDPTFGIPQYNPANVGGIFQFEVFRLSSHAISGSAFQIHPVLNGSARPTFIVIGIPHPVLTYSSSVTNPANPLQSLQILYNGQTVWDEPYFQVTAVGNNLLPLYAESARYADTERGLGLGKMWWNYASWAADHAWIIVNIAPSHNKGEIQPNSSAPVEIRGQFTVPAPAGLNIRVGLFFDQTMLLQKNNTAIFSLPIY